ncbi:putative leucine-rich repeat-containing protein DDB_G0290503 [Argiope bruennichi]|uniref:putative leucine-rich repeat-containing protein DDB_G0290503 n=1 Tax=Argiope bruennichi TaxID=94029 RepID=UPI002494BF08|nr:putative leucine-rich repeat-containing protein DDB_G0290503 [Argiope bruennichi]
MEAFQASQPLVDQYSEVYRMSNSFLDFLFKLCHVPLPPSPLQTDSVELDTCKRKNLELENSLREKMNIITQRDEQLSEWQHKFNVKERELIQLQTQWNETQSIWMAKENQLQSQFEELKSMVTPQEAVSASEEPYVTHPEETLASNMVTGLFTPQPLEYVKPDPIESYLTEWQDKTKLPSLAIMERLDNVEQHLMDKSIELERLLEKSPDIQQQLQEKEYSINNLNSEINALKEETTQINALKGQINNLQREIEGKNILINNLKTEIEDKNTLISTLQVVPTEHSTMNMDVQEQLFAKRDKQLVTSPILNYCKSELPHVAFKVTWEDEIINYLKDYIDSKGFLKNLFNKLNITHLPEEKLANAISNMISFLLSSLQTANEKVELIRLKMLSLMDENSQLQVGQVSNIDQNFFVWLQQKVEEMKTQLNTTQMQFYTVQNQLLQTDKDSTQVISIQEVDDHEMLALPCSSTKDYERLQIEKDDWKNKFHTQLEKAKQIQQDLDKFVYAVVTPKVPNTNRSILNEF